MANTKAKNPAQDGAVVTEAREPEKKIVPKGVDLNQYVVVRNGFHGRLVYRSSRTGEKFVWDGFGSEQEMELKELRNAKNTSKAFFQNNWFMFDEDWIVDFLGIRQFYKNAIRVDDFDSIFSKTPAELKKLIASMSVGQKKSVAYRAVQMITDGDIDSRKTIAALEESLGVELIEK